MFNFIMDGSKDLTKQTTAHEMKFKHPQNEIILGPKPTLVNKRNKGEGAYKE
jgi:hypothetical protein